MGLLAVMGAIENRKREAAQIKPEDCTRVHDFRCCPKCGATR